MRFHAKMSLDKCGQCMRFTMLVGNVASLAGGILVLVVGVWTCVDSSYLKELLGTNIFLSSANILVACGVVITLLSVVGCLGALKEVKCLLLINFVVLFFVFVVLLVGGILAYVFQGLVHEKMKNTMLSTIKLDYGKVQSVTETWDTLQLNLRCCGVDVDEERPGQVVVPVPGYKVWMRNPLFRSPSGPHVPLSCCIRSEDSSFVNQDDCQGPSPSNISCYYDGCYEQTSEMVRERAFVLGSIGIGIACLMVLGMIFSCTLFKIIDQSN